MAIAPRPDEPLLCNTFTEFVERIALPRLLENPRALRLDGQDGVGNREVAGRFFFAGRQWKVHSDTHFEPLLLAYWQAGRHGEAATFERAATGAGEKLDLVSERRRFRSSVRRRLYIYGEHPGSSGPKSVRRIMVWRPSQSRGAIAVDRLIVSWRLNRWPLLTGLRRRRPVS